MSMCAVRLDLNLPVLLDWSKLLGFDQVRRSSTLARPSLKEVAFTKVGGKPCFTAPK
jgi:hypothetical protein